MKKKSDFIIENCSDEIGVIITKKETYGDNRFKIGILNIDFDCTKIKLSNRDNGYYYDYVFSDNSQKIGRSRNDVAYCVGEENLLAAEKQVEKNLKSLNKRLKENLKNPVMQELSRQVEKHVKNYKSDFYHHDNYFIMKYNLKSFIIVLRENGSHILPLNNSMAQNNYLTIDYILKDNQIYHCFICDMNTNTVNEIPLQELEKYR